LRLLDPFDARVMRHASENSSHGWCQIASAHVSEAAPMVARAASARRRTPTRSSCPKHWSCLLQSQLQAVPAV